MYAPSPSVSVLNIAHRGARSLAPENTLEAIDKAAQAGADAVEIDVQLTADGAVVAFHDDDLVRCTDAVRKFPHRAPWRVCDFALADIRALDAGSWFVDELRRPAAQREPWLRSLSAAEREEGIAARELAHYGCGAVRVPLLAECLERCRHHALALHVELKLVPRFYPRLAERVIGEVLAHGMQDSVMLSSFDHAALAHVRSIAPQLSTAVLTGDRLYRPAEYLARVGACAYNPGCAGEHDTIGFGAVAGALDCETIAAVRDAGYEVYVWTENDPERMARLLDAGVSGIYTDYPQRLRALLEARGMARRPVSS